MPRNALSSPDVEQGSFCALAGMQANRNANANGIRRFTGYLETDGENYSENSGQGSVNSGQNNVRRSRNDHGELASPGLGADSWFLTRDIWLPRLVTVHASL